MDTMLHEVLYLPEHIMQISLIFKQIARIINIQNRKHGLFPHSKEFYTVLAHYVALECSVLFSSPTERLIKVHIQKRLVSSFTSLLYDTNGRLTRNIRSCRSAALLNILFIFTLVSKEHKEQYDYLESMAVIIVKELNMMGDFVKLVAERECFSVQKMLRLPHFRIIYRFFQRCNKNMHLTDYPTTNYNPTKDVSRIKADDADSDFDDDAPIFNVPHKINGIMLKPRQDKCFIYFLDALATPTVDSFKKRPTQLQKFLVKSPVSASNTKVMMMQAMKQPETLRNVPNTIKLPNGAKRELAVLHMDLAKPQPGSVKFSQIPKPKLKVSSGTEETLEDYHSTEEILPLEMPVQYLLESTESEFCESANISEHNVSVSCVCVISRTLEDLTETLTTLTPKVLPNTVVADDTFQESYSFTPIINKTESQTAILYKEPQTFQESDNVLCALCSEAPLGHSALSTTHEGEFQTAVFTETSFAIGLKYTEPRNLLNMYDQKLRRFDFKVKTYLASCNDHEVLPLDLSNVLQTESVLPVVCSEGAPVDCIQTLHLPTPENTITLPFSHEVPTEFECTLEISGFQVTVCALQEIVIKETKFANAATHEINVYLPLRYVEEQLQKCDILDTSEKTYTALSKEHDCEFYTPCSKTVNALKHSTSSIVIKIPLKNLGKELCELVFHKKGCVYSGKYLNKPDLDNYFNLTTKSSLQGYYQPFSISSTKPFPHIQSTGEEFDFELEDERSEFSHLVNQIINKLENSNEKLSNNSEIKAHNLDLLASVADERSKIVGPRKRKRKNSGFRSRRPKKQNKQNVTSQILTTSLDNYDDETLDEGLVLIEHCRQDINKITVCCTIPPSPIKTNNVTPSPITSPTLENDEMKLKTIPFKKRKSYRESDEVELTEVKVPTSTKQKRHRKSTESNLCSRRVTRSITANLKLIEPVLSPRTSRVRSGGALDDADADELIYSLTEEYEDLKNESLEEVSAEKFENLHVETVVQDMPTKFTSRMKDTKVIEEKQTKAIKKHKIDNYEEDSLKDKEERPIKKTKKDDPIQKSVEESLTKTTKSNKIDNNKKLGKSIEATTTKMQCKFNDSNPPKIDTPPRISKKEKIKSYIDKEQKKQESESIITEATSNITDYINQASRLDCYVQLTITDQHPKHLSENENANQKVLQDQPVDKPKSTVESENMEEVKNITKTSPNSNNQSEIADDVSFLEELEEINSHPTSVEAQQETESAMEIHSESPKLVASSEVDMIQELGLGFYTKEQIAFTGMIGGITLEFEQSSSIQVTPLINDIHGFIQCDASIENDKSIVPYNNINKFEEKNKEVEVTSISKQLENAACEYEANISAGSPMLYLNEAILQTIQAETSSNMFQSVFQVPRSKEQIEMDDENLPYGAIEEISDTKLTISKLEAIHFSAFNNQNIENPVFNCKSAKVIVERLPSIENEFEPIRAIKAPSSPSIIINKEAVDDVTFEAVPRNDNFTDDNINIINEILQEDVDVDAMSFNDSVIVQMVGESTNILENLVCDYDCNTITEIENDLDVNKDSDPDHNQLVDTVQQLHSHTPVIVQATTTHTATSTVMPVNQIAPSHKNVSNFDVFTNITRQPAKLKQRTRSFNEIIKSLENIKTNELQTKSTVTLPPNKSEENGVLFSDLDILCANVPSLYKPITPRGYSDINDPCLNSICKDDKLQPYVSDDTKLSPVTFPEFGNEVECDLLNYLTYPIDVDKSRVSPDSTSSATSGTSSRQNNRKNSPKKCVNKSTYDSRTNWEQGIPQKTEDLNLRKRKHTETEYDKTEVTEPEIKTYKKQLVEIIPIKNAENTKIPNRNRSKNENPNELFEELKSKKFYESRDQVFNESFETMYKRNQIFDEINSSALFASGNRSATTYKGSQFKPNTFDDRRNKIVEEHKSKPFQIKHNVYEKRRENKMFDENEINNEGFKEIKNKAFEELKNKMYEESKNKVLEEHKSKSYRRRNKKFEESANVIFDEIKKSGTYDDTINAYAYEDAKPPNKYHFDTKKHTEYSSQPDYETKPKSKGEYKVTILAPLASSTPQQENKRKSRKKEVIEIQTRITKIYCDNKKRKCLDESLNETESSSESSPTLTLTSSTSECEAEDLRVKRPVERKIKVKRRKRADFTSIEKLLQSTPTYERSYSPIPDDMYAPVQVYVQANMSLPTQVNVSVPTQVSMSVPTQVNISGSTQVNISVPTHANMSRPTQVNVSVPTHLNRAGPSHVNIPGASINAPGPSHINRPVHSHMNVQLPQQHVVPTSSLLNLPTQSLHLNTSATTSPFSKHFNKPKNEPKFPEQKLSKGDVVADKNLPNQITKTSNVCVVNPILRSITHEQTRSCNSTQQSFSLASRRQAQNPLNVGQLNQFHNPTSHYIGQRLYASVNHNRPHCCIPNVCSFHAKQKQVVRGEYGEITKEQNLHKCVNTQTTVDTLTPLRKPGDCGIYTASDFLRMQSQSTNSDNLYTPLRLLLRQETVQRPLQIHQSLSNCGALCRSQGICKLNRIRFRMRKINIKTSEKQSSRQQMQISLILEASNRHIATSTLCNILMPQHSLSSSSSRTRDDVFVGFPPLILFKVNRKKEDKDDDRAWLARIESQVPDALDDRNIFGSS